MSEPPTVLLVNGPNLNLLGEREPEIYGRTTLEEIVGRVTDRAAARGVRIEALQSNHEGVLIDFLHARRKAARGILINPGALTHYSYALRDAIAAVGLPCVEVHLTDLATRAEGWRRRSVTGEVAFATVMGKGPDGYLEALDALLAKLGVP